MTTSVSKISCNFTRYAFIRILIFLISILLIGHCLSVYLLIEYPRAKDDGSFFGKLIQLFNFDIEANLPTFFSSLLLLLNAILLTLITFIYKQTKSNYKLWAGLAIIFFFLSLDEMIGIHEHLIQPTRNLLNTSGYLYYAWVIPYGVFMFILGFVYAGFLWRLPKNILFLFFLAGMVFLFGAIGMELLGAMQYEKKGKDNLGYYLLSTVEELMEMSGSTIFSYALLSYLSMKFESISFSFHTK